MSAAVGVHSGSNPLSLMSCVRESSPPQDAEFESEKNVGAAAKRKFWNPRKWFRRKNKAHEDAEPSDTAIAKDGGLRSRSASELSLAADDHHATRRKNGTPMHPGLSVSHDSVFHSPHSGSELELEQSSSLSIIHPPPDFGLQTELSERLRLRRGRGDTSEDDEGLPHSPCCNSPTATEGLLEKAHNKDHPTKSHSTCSDGSLLSMGSSEMDDDSYSQQQSRHSSKVSLLENKKAPDSIEGRAVTVFRGSDSAWELGPSLSRPLNHSAAHHKSAVRPKRTHGAPRRRKVQQPPANVLPTTPEVNEEIPRTSTPERINKEIITELYSLRTETQLKCSSLPPGLAGPGAFGRKLTRSSSNAASKSQEHFVEEDEEDKEERTDKSFFERLFPRRSNKKKKEKSMIVVKTTTSMYTTTRTGAASRQRVQPIDIPASPELTRKDSEVEVLVQPKFSPPEKVSSGTSPLQAELETKFKQRTSEVRVSVDCKRDVPRSEEPKSKVRIAGLSSLQQRVLLHDNDETDEGFKSLTDFPMVASKVCKPVTKSHSFKAVVKEQETKTEPEMSVVKAASLDSVKNLESFEEEKPKMQISVTKVQLKEPSSKTVPEFLNRQLNKVETRPTSNVVFKTSTSPKIIDEEMRPKTIFTFLPTEKISDEPTPIKKEPADEPLRKFSKDDIEIVDKGTEEEIVEVPKQPLVTVTPLTPQRIYKKHETPQRKSSMDKPALKTKSSSLEIVGSVKKETFANLRASQDSLVTDENVVVLRRKSLPKHKTDDEPELMKVFARRSLKLKDNESEEVAPAIIVSKNVADDKENVFESPPPLEEQRRKSVVKEPKEPLTETTDVTLRKPVNNNKFAYHRAVSVSTPKAEVLVDVKVRKQASFNERPKVDNWFLSKKVEAETEEIVSPKSELIEDFAVKTNFNQKKAEWEKRAQEALKKNVP